MNKNGTLKIVPLGGWGEVGKNLTVMEYNNDIIVIDCGLSFPEEEMLGIDVVIPDMTYLIRNKKRIKGLVITHGHEDHIGGIPYLLKEVNVPIYGTKLTLGLLETKFREHRLKNVKLNIVNYGQKVKLGAFEVEFIKVGHSIPDSAALAIKTPLGRIVHTGDFKIDHTPIDGDVIDLSRFAEIGNEGVLALLSDSTNAEKPGYTKSESTVGETFDNIFGKHNGRIIVATFASNIHRIQQIIDSSEASGRKVILSGRSMLNNTKVAQDLGYLTVKDGTLIDLNDINKYRSNEITFIMTGSQGEPMAALSRIASSDHRRIQLEANDLVILSATPIPGNEKTVGRVINNLIDKGIKVINHTSQENVHVSGHASQEELKLMLTLVKPKFFIPMHGEARQLNKHRELAEELGIAREDIFVIDNGCTVEFSKQGARLGNKVPAGNILVDGLGVGDVGNIVLRDRKHLSEDGLIVIVVTISKENGKVLAGPDLISRGFVYVRESEDLLKDARNIVNDVLSECEKENITDWATLKFRIRNALRNQLYSSIKRNPMILPIIMEV